MATPNDPLSALDFYSHNNVLFLTGWTGFIGKVVLEKVLRSLPQVQKIYLLTRTSSMATLDKRMEKELHGSHIFKALKARFPNDRAFQEYLRAKVVLVEGNIAQDRLGLSETDREMVQRDTNVVIHCAASVGFLDPLRIAFSMNTQGSLRVFELARGMPCLRSLVHVSTSYVNIHMKGLHVKEEIYPHPIGDPESLFKMLLQMSEDEISAFERDVVLSTYPSTYAFTKSLTEHLIQSRYEIMALPIVIVRPSIVGGSIFEPIPGWCQGLGATSGLMVNCGLGKIQEWAGDEKKVIDIVPVDVVCKSLLMAAVAVAANLFEQPSVPIIQVGTSTTSPITVGTLCSYSEQYWQSAPAPRGRASSDVRLDLYLLDNFRERYRQRFFEEMEQARTNRDGRPKKPLPKAVLIPEMFHPFMCYEWFFEMRAYLTLDKIAPEVLCSHLGDGIDWLTYLHYHNLGVQEFILNERVDWSMSIKYRTARLSQKASHATSDEIHSRHRLSVPRIRSRL